MPKPSVSVLSFAPSLEILDGLYQFITDDIGTTSEIIMLYLNDFTSTDQQLEGLFADILHHDVQSKIVKSADHNLTTESISDLVSSGVNIIIFTDQFPLGSTSDSFQDWFFDSILFVNPLVDPDQYSKSNLTDSLSEVQGLILSKLRSGWNADTLNLIEWTPIISDVFVEKWYFDSFFSFSTPFRNQFHIFTAKYPKLWFGNVIIADFIGSNDIVQQSIALNLRYAECSDIFGPNCAEITDLSNHFTSTDIPSQCSSTIADGAFVIDEVCKRSCGLCQDSIFGYPGDSCSNHTDCDGAIYGLFSDKNIGICEHAPDTFGDSFCLSVQPQKSCIDYWSTSFDQCADSLNVSQCDTSCGADHECLDGYCNPTYAVCMSWNTTIWDSFQSVLKRKVLQKYLQIASNGAKTVLERLEWLRPGDSSAPYQETSGEANCQTDTGGEIMGCIVENVSVSPYMTSVIGLVLIPLILSLLLCVCYCCIWPWWCFCETKTKKCCCDTHCRRCHGLYCYYYIPCCPPYKTGFVSNLTLSVYQMMTLRDVAVNGAMTMIP